MGQVENLKTVCTRTSRDYRIGTIKCSYGVPDHITYGAATSGSALLG
jgi:hypothetical protein